MSHFDYIKEVAPGFKVIAHTKDCPVAAAEDEEKKLYAIQFHPEVLHTEYGKEILSNYVYNVCECKGDWKMDTFVEESIKAIREKVGDGKVLLALSGGVDSSVAAGLLSKVSGRGSPHPEDCAARDAAWNNGERFERAFWKKRGLHLRIERDEERFPVLCGPPEVRREDARNR